MKQKPYQLLLWTGLILVLVSFAVLPQGKAIDIHLHDTYFVIAKTQVFWLLAVLAVLLWTLYRLTRNILYSKSLSWVHVVATVLALLLFGLTLLLDQKGASPAPRQYDGSASSYALDPYPPLVKIIGLSLLLFLAAQVLFVVNLIAGLFKRIRRR